MQSWNQLLNALIPCHTRMHRLFLLLCASPRGAPIASDGGVIRPALSNEASILPVPLPFPDAESRLPCPWKSRKRNRWTARRRAEQWVNRVVVILNAYHCGEGAFKACAPLVGRSPSATQWRLIDSLVSDVLPSSAQQCHCWWLGTADAAQVVRLNLHRL